jgi:hypothetical protein
MSSAPCYRSLRHALRHKSFASSLFYLHGFVCVTRGYGAPTVGVPAEIVTVGVDVGEEEEPPRVATIAPAAPAAAIATIIRTFAFVLSPPPPPEEELLPPLTTGPTTFV